MKKKLGRVSALLVAVLCVCLLCVPAFASAPLEGELVEILPETTVTDENFSEVFASLPPLGLVVGDTYIVNMNGMDIPIVASVLDFGDVGTAVSLVDPDGQWGFFDLPPELAAHYGFNVILESGLTPPITFSIYQVAPSQSEVIFSNITTYVDALRTQFSIGSFVEVLAYAVGIGVGFVFLWWGVRKAVRAIMSGFKKGKLRL